MNQKLKRYDLNHSQGYCGCKMEEMIEGHGDYVKFSDIEPLIEALKFYAHESNWDEVWVDGHGIDDGGDCSCQIDFDDVEMKRDEEGTLYYTCGGLKARQALKSIGVEV